MKESRKEKNEQILKGVKDLEEFCEKRFQLFLKLAKEQRAGTIVIINIFEFLKGMGGIENCAIYVIRKLRDNNINVCFVEDNLESIDPYNDFEIGARLALAGLIMKENNGKED